MKMDYLFEAFYDLKTSNAPNEEKDAVKDFLKVMFDENVGGKSFVDRYNAWYKKNKEIKN